MGIIDMVTNVNIPRCVDIVAGHILESILKVGPMWRG